MCTCALLAGCPSTTVKQPCPEGAQPLSAFESSVDGKVSAKIQTPEGGISLDVVDERKIPVQATAEAIASFSQKAKGFCIPETVLNSPEK